MDIVLHLVELYFRHVHGQTYSFLHKPSFIPRIKQGKVNRTLLLALCGLTARYSRHPSIASSTPHEAGERFIAAARKSLSEEFDEPTIETIQAVIIIVQHDFFRSKGKKSMIYVSLAIRMAATLELHVEPNDPDMLFQEREARRRTYWSLVVLDRLAHSGPHWQVHLRTDTIHLQLPCRDYYYENNIPVITETLQGTEPPPIRVGGMIPVTRKGELGLHAYIVKTTIIWCDINKYVMEEFKNETIPPWKEGSRFHELETGLQELFASLPTEYHYSRERLMALDTLNHGTSLVHLHVELVLSLCSLSRSMYPFNYRKMKFSEPPPKAFIERAAVNIMSSANAQSAMIDDVLGMEDFHMAPFIGFGVFAVSSVHIANSFSPDPAVASAAKNNLAINLKFLVIMREYWYSVGVWCIILKDRYFQKAKRHKLKSQQSSYDTQSASSIGIIESIPVNNQATTAESDQAAQAFSRPGSPPLVYAPEDFINVAMNKAQQQSSASSSGMVTPSGIATPNGTTTPNGSNSSYNDVRVPEDTAARTWERAVANPYSLSDQSGSPVAKQSKVNDSPKDSTAPTYLNPASPSQFADIFTRSAYRKPSDGNSDIVKQETTPSDVIPETEEEALKTISNVSPFSDSMVPKAKNNLLQDTSGEWLNSLELDDFAQFASHDERSLIDFNNPAYWFDTEMKTQEQEARNGKQSDTSGGAGGEGIRRVTVMRSDNGILDTRREDASLFQQAILHQPFAPDLESLDSTGKSVEEEEDDGGETTPTQQDVGLLADATPKTQTLLDEMFQQVAMEPVPRRPSSPDIMTL